MMEQCWKIRRFAVVLLLFLGLTGCGLFDRGSGDSPTMPALPTEEDSMLLGNFIVAAGTSDQFAVVYVGQGLFQFSIPGPGDFLLTYVTNAQTLHLVLRAQNRALVTIGLPPGETFQNASLQQGTIVANARPITQSGAVLLFTWPNQPWNTLFIPGGSGAAPLPPGGTIVIAAVGNSITYGLGSRRGGYPGILESKLRNAGYNVIVRNEGIPGEHSHQTLARFPSMLASADIILLMTGTNDIGASLCPGRHCRVAGNIAAMLDQAARVGKIVIVSTITPQMQGYFVGWSNYNDTVRALNREIVAVANARGVPVADSYRTIVNHGWNALFVDRLHFNDWGYDWISWGFFDILARGNGILQR